MADRVQFRRDLAVNWYAYNPILLEGEVAFDIDTDQYKVGDGVHNWRDLVYRGLPCVQQKGTSTTTPMSQKAVTDELTEMQAEIDALVAGAKMAVTVSPACIYKNAATEVTITATVSNVTPSEISIREDSQSGTVIATNTDARSVSIRKTYTLNDNQKSFFGLSTYKSININGSVNLQARYPIFYGFGRTAADIAVSGSRLSARTSATGSYPSVTAAEDGVNYYILVPTDIPALSSFTMGGAPYVMTSTTETIEGVTYRVYKSGAIYNTGAVVQVVAS
ncbi:MAG: hypothetical protein IJE12_07260 [Prevotella sp.]|nr:hypothetical protein [Prevotella sp.]